MLRKLFKKSEELYYFFEELYVYVKKFLSLETGKNIHLVDLLIKVSPTHQCPILSKYNSLMSPLVTQRSDEANLIFSLCPAVSQG